MAYINILFPVYNEQLRLENGIRRTIEYLEEIEEKDYELTIVDNASIDDTQIIAEHLCENFRQVKYIRLEEKGVGVAFRAGIAANAAPIVGYMDIDLSADISHLAEVIARFRSDSNLCMINASRWNKESNTSGRKWYRNLTSHGLTWLLKITLHMKASDAICGFKFFRKETVEKLIQQADSSENGWFYIIELLLRAERSGLSIYELPIHWEDEYHTTVQVGKLIRNYCVHIIKLRKTFREEGKK